MKPYVKALLSSAFRTRIGYWAVRSMISATQYRVFSPRTTGLMRFDALRLKARLRGNGSNLTPIESKLHFGCGAVKIKGWLNVDVTNSDFDVDLAMGSLPWANSVFSAIVGEHIVEHLELESELLPLLREFRRVSSLGAEIWLSCPDMGKTCRGYLDDKGTALLAHIKQQRPLIRIPDDCPPQHIVNRLFHQDGEHKNLYDFELLQWALNKAGFTACRQIQERELLTRFPEIPLRDDDYHSLYVCALAA